ncbi:MAG: hypothetical protein HFG68_14660 [Hungatella sp.]|nr:hypothetical protein [Hungatella sp.]
MSIYGLNTNFCCCSTMIPPPVFDNYIIPNIGGGIYFFSGLVLAQGDSIPFWYGGLSHRLITDYLSLSNHLQIKWLITPATTAVTKDRTSFIASASFR